MFAKGIRSALAIVLVVGGLTGAASAFDRCNPCRPVRRPVNVVRPTCPPVYRNSYSTRYVETAPTYTAPTTYVNTTSYAASTPAYNVTTTSATTTYDVGPMTSATASVNNSNIPYLVPSQDGLLETSTVPPAHNEVEEWYAGWNRMNNQSPALD